MIKKLIQTLDRSREVNDLTLPLHSFWPYGIAFSYHSIFLMNSMYSWWMTSHIYSTKIFIIYIKLYTKNYIIYFCTGQSKSASDNGHSFRSHKIASRKSICFSHTSRYVTHYFRRLCNNSRVSRWFYNLILRKIRFFIFNYMNGILLNIVKFLIYNMRWN